MVYDDDFLERDRENWLWMAGVRGGWLELLMTSLTLRRGNGAGKRLLMKQSMMGIRIESRNDEDRTSFYVQYSYDCFENLLSTGSTASRISKTATVRATKHRFCLRRDLQRFLMLHMYKQKRHHN